MYSNAMQLLILKSNCLYLVLLTSMIVIDSLTLGRHDSTVCRLSCCCCTRIKFGIVVTKWYGRNRWSYVCQLATTWLTLNLHALRTQTVEAHSYHHSNSNKVHTLWGSVIWFLGEVAEGYSSWAVLVFQLLGQELLPHRRTLKSFSENVQGGWRVGALQPDSQHF